MQSQPLIRDDEAPSPCNDEPTTQLVLRAKSGDHSALEELLQRCLPSLHQWARGRVPAAARGRLDAGDLVQDTALHVVTHLDSFTPLHAGATRAYFRVALLNRIRDEARKLARRPAVVELTDELPCTRATPLQLALEADTFRRYREAVSRLSPKNRDLVIARVERNWNASEIAHRFGYRTSNAARMAVKRALERLAARIRAAQPPVATEPAGREDEVP